MVRDGGKGSGGCGCGHSGGVDGKGVCKGGGQAVARAVVGEFSFLTNY